MRWYFGFPGGSDGKESPATQQTWIPSLGWEGSLEKEMASHSNILAWRIPWTEEPGGLQSKGLQRVRHDSVTNTFTFTFNSEEVLGLHAATKLSSSSATNT